jgi:hypothetical protein
MNTARQTAIVAREWMRDGARVASAVLLAVEGSIPARRW